MLQSSRVRLQQHYISIAEKLTQSLILRRKIIMRLRHCFVCDQSITITVMIVCWINKIKVETELFVQLSYHTVCMTKLTFQNLKNEFSLLSNIPLCQKYILLSCLIITSDDSDFCYCFFSWMLHFRIEITEWLKLIVDSMTEL